MRRRTSPLRPCIRPGSSHHCQSRAKCSLVVIHRRSPMRHCCQRRCAPRVARVGSRPRNEQPIALPPTIEPALQATRETRAATPSTSLAPPLQLAIVAPLWEEGNLRATEFPQSLDRSRSECPAAVRTSRPVHPSQPTAKQPSERAVSGSTAKHQTNGQGQQSVGPYRQADWQTTDCAAQQPRPCGPDFLVRGVSRQPLHRSEEEQTKLHPPCKAELCLTNVVECRPNDRRSVPRASNRS